MGGVGKIDKSNISNPTVLFLSVMSLSVCVSFMAWTLTSEGYRDSDLGKHTTTVVVQNYG